MVERVIGVTALCAAALLATYATVGRMAGLHRPRRWGGGGQITLTGELAVAGFIASIGGGIAFDSVTFLLTALPCWLIGYDSQERANRQFRREEDLLRAENAKLYPGIFDHDPPQQLQGLETDASMSMTAAHACIWGALQRVRSGN